MEFSKEQIEDMACSVPFWWHSIDLGKGVTTHGHKPPAQLEYELSVMSLPDLRGKSILDIGAWDGYFSFAAERLGAERVLALDHYMWSMDIPGLMNYCQECKDRGIAPKLGPETPFWRPSELPGKRGF